MIALSLSGLAGVLLALIGLCYRFAYLSAVRQCMTQRVMLAEYEAYDEEAQRQSDADWQRMQPAMDAADEANRRRDLFGPQAQCPRPMGATPDLDACSADLHIDAPSDAVAAELLIAKVAK